MSSIARRITNYFRNLSKSYDQVYRFETEKIQNQLTRMTLYDFSNKDDFMKFEGVSDKEMQGKSTIEIKASYTEDSEIEKQIKRRIYKENQRELNEKEKSNTNTLVMKGNLSLFVPEERKEEKINEKNENEKENNEFEYWIKKKPQAVKQLGYASILSKKSDPPIDLSDYNAIVLTCKTDGRPYSLNLRFDVLNDHDLHQQIFITEKDKWEQVILPFDKFIRTWRGIVEADQSYLDPTKFENLSILMGERKEGPFNLEIRKIEALNIQKYGSKNRYDLLIDEELDENIHDRSREVYHEIKFIEKQIRIKKMREDIRLQEEKEKEKEKQNISQQKVDDDNNQK